MTVVAGIDEAGYGPTLGPLVLAATAFRLEQGATEADLNRFVRTRQEPDGLPLGDSKRLYTGTGSLARLETSVLGHATLGRGVLPLRTHALLKGAVDFRAKEAEALPWYGQRLLATRLPRAANVPDLLERAAHQAARYSTLGVTFLDFLVAPVPVPRFNRLSGGAGSKAWTLFYMAGRLIETLVSTWPDDELIIHIDRQGGRIHYGSMLQTFFPLAPLATLRERRAESAYVLDWPDRGQVRIDFRVKADGSRTPVALASVVAKYTRELFVECLNDWFRRKLKGLRPTAGYPDDARRWLKDVKGYLGTRPTLRGKLVRCR